MTRYNFVVIVYMIISGYPPLSPMLWFHCFKHSEGSPLLDVSDLDLGFCLKHSTPVFPPNKAHRTHFSWNEIIDFYSVDSRCNMLNSFGLQCWCWVSECKQPGSQLWALNISWSTHLQAPVPLSIFRSNSKFDENSERYSFKSIRPITTIFCTRHDSDTVVTCAKCRYDRPRIFYTRVFWIFIEFDRNMLSGTRARSTCWFQLISLNDQCHE